MMAVAASRVEELINYFKSHNKIREQQSHSAKVHSVGWSCDGKYLASGSFDKSVCIFSLCPDRLKQETTFRGHGGSVDQLCWHAFCPELLSTASGDKTVRIWDTRTQKCTANISTRGENINISWSPDGNTIAVGNKEDLVTFIDARVMKIRAEEQFNFEVNEISWNKDSDTFYLTNGQGCVHILSYPELELLHVIKAHPGTCICIEFDPTGRYFATGSADALVSLWDADELCCLRTFSRLEWPVRTISFSYDGQLLAAASEDLVIDIGEVQTGEKIADVPVEAATFTVAWHPKQYLLAYACDDKDSYDRKRDAAGTSRSSLDLASFDDRHLLMANSDGTKTICECQYTLGENAQETKNNFESTPNIHEIDEEESESEETTALKQPNFCASDEEGDKTVRVQKTKETSDDESVYTGESFCSDGSCDESEVTSGSLNSSSLIRVTDLQLSQSSKEQEDGISGSRKKNDHQDVSYLLNDELPRIATADRDRFAKSRKCRRWNMSFTDEEMRKIERENELLLRKIMTQQKPRHKILSEGTIQSRTSSSAINRKKLQKKIENDNVLLLRRIQQAKSCVFTNTSKMGCRLTFL